MDWPFGDLRPFSYGLIYADPPWRQEMYSEETGTRKAPQAHYACMPLDEIKALPVGHLAAPDCYIVMWSLWNFVAPGYATNTLQAWGFAPKSGGSWHKVTKHGKAAMGTGYGFRGCCEPFLTGSIGKPKVHSRGERNGFTTDVDADFELNALLAQAREHSRKPEEMREALERMFPDVRKVELFSRRPACDRWDVWGNETAKFQDTTA
ncbi:MT-A70 family methyltransferase [Azospirillum argentinense]|nr:MT-A70 family methyltransferase [Azospirillum argentinense]